MSRKTKSELEKLNHDMARFMIRLCRDSDRNYGGNRSDHVEANYRKCLRLIKRAGLTYKAPPA